MFVPYSQSKIVGAPRREDSEDLRLGSCVKCWESPELDDLLPQIQKEDTLVLGYADDRGVDRNGGRPGASEAPDQIRHWLYKMALSSQESNPKPRIWDLGNLRSWSVGLLEAHEQARRALKSVRDKGARILTLGGGHDWAFADFVDFGATFSSAPSHIINLDAHLDMRPLPESAEIAGHSGTPFRRILAAPEFSKQTKMSVIGLQQHCNAISHIRWAQGHQVTLQFLEDLPLGLSEQWNLISEKLDLSSGDAKHFALSIDMDVFAQSDAPGVSAPQPFGLNRRLAHQLIKQLGARTRHLGIYETNPRFDVDHATVRLAARLAYEFCMI